MKLKNARLLILILAVWMPKPVGATSGRLSPYLMLKYNQLIKKMREITTAIAEVRAEAGSLVQELRAGNHREEAAHILLSLNQLCAIPTEAQKAPQMKERAVQEPDEFPVFQATQPPITVLPITNLNRANKFYDDKDYVHAMDYYKSAENQTLNPMVRAAARVRLGEMYLAGQGVPQDLNIARSYLEQVTSQRVNISARHKAMELLGKLEVEQKNRANPSSAEEVDWKWISDVLSGMGQAPMSDESETFNEQPGYFERLPSLPLPILPGDNAKPKPQKRIKAGGFD